MERKEFIVKLSLGLAALAGVAASIPVMTAFFAPLIETPLQKWRRVGSLDDFKVGTTNQVTFENAEPKAWAGVTARSAAWLRRDTENKFTAFSVNCTHLGCPVRWENDAQLFMCPCHGGVYYKDGSVASGPPPKPLVQYPVRINNGQVEIQTSPMPITSINS